MGDSKITNYEEIQEYEIEALQSIYMDDFVEQKAKTAAWNRKAEREFRLRLKPSSLDHDDQFTSTLTVCLPSTYPKTLPRLKFEFGDRISKKSRASILKIIETRPKALLGSEMIFEIASSIQEILDDEAATAAEIEDLPALDEERALQEAAAQKKAEVDRELLLQQKQQAEDEEKRVLSELVERERMRAAKNRARTARSVANGDADALASGDLYFDQDVTIKGQNGAPIEFRAITNTVKYRAGPITTVYTTAPALSGRQADEVVAVLALKSCSMQVEKNKVQNLEAKLEALNGLPSHPNVLDLLAFRVSQTPGRSDSWEVSILTPFAQNRSIQDLLDTLSTIDPHNARTWSIQILEGIDFLHRQKIVHGRLLPENVLLQKNDAGVVVAILGDASFQKDLHVLVKGDPVKFSTAASAYWVAPEIATGDLSKSGPPQDIWDFGGVLLQMLFGLDIKNRFQSPESLTEGMVLSEPLEDLVEKLFKSDPKKRPSAFELLPHEFLREDVPLVEEEVDLPAKSPQFHHTRTGSNRMTTVSRYAKEFVEAGRLGKGGFGEVVRARHRLESRFYAIKKVTSASPSGLSKVLSEVMLLSTLNNPYIVRYYTAWTETTGESSRRSSDASESDDEDQAISAITSSRAPGLDFISSRGDQDQMIEFEYDSDSDEDAGSEAIEFESSDDEDTPSAGPDGPAIEFGESSEQDVKAESPRNRRKLAKRRRSSANILSKTTLYIQMELCEKRTLRDLIHGNLHADPEEIWRFFSQILDGLAHVHSKGVIHRDLKPENIFIVQDDNNTIPRIGDFGLARPGDSSNRNAPKGFMVSILTASIGTSMYVAPEVKSSGGGSYNQKADMYSLGVIFFEMCFPLKTGMERARTLGELREKNFVFPPVFSEPEMQQQAEVIRWLVKHRPGERPTSRELLKSGKIPSRFEDEVIQLALRSLSDKSSPIFNKLMTGLFSQMSEAPDAKDLSYDLDRHSNARQAEHLHMHSMVKQSLIKVFEHHGAVENQRQILLPSSKHYSTSVRLIDSEGTIVQLPYDLTLPYARFLATPNTSVVKTYSFGNVFRESNVPGVHPRSHGEVDFDIVTNNSLDLALREAEVIKVVDEIIEITPSMDSGDIVYHLNHSKILNRVLSFCEIEVEDQVKQIISRLNVGQWTWTKIRKELRDFGVKSLSLDDLAKFNFRERLDKAIPKLRQLLKNETEDLESTFRHMEAVTTYLKQFQVKGRVYLSPIASVNEHFYRGNILFQCIYERKRKSVICAGGRYDSLIQEFRTVSKLGRHAVGFNLAWENLIDSMSRYHRGSGKSKASEDESSYNPILRQKRCEVLVDSFEPARLRTAGIKIVQELWMNGISAELVIDSKIKESTSFSHQNKEEGNSYGWIVFIKQDESLRVRNVARKEDHEVRASELINWLRQEMRDAQSGSIALYSHRQHQHAHGDTAAADSERHANVSVFVAQSRSKKTNRRHVVDDALSRTAELARSFLNAPIVAVEMKDESFEALQATRLADAESWRRFVQAAPINERQYLAQLQDMLTDKAEAAKTAGTGERAAFVYNFLSKACFYYDLGL